MKKTLLSLLTVLYMTVSSGIALEIHYCMGKQAGMDLYGSGSDKCGRCGMTEKKGGCCNDEHKLIKLSDSHKQSSIEPVNILFVTALLPEAARMDHLLPAANSQLPTSYSPPEDTGPGACIMNCVFRI